MRFGLSVMIVVLCGAGAAAYADDAAAPGAGDGMADGYQPQIHELFALVLGERERRATLEGDTLVVSTKAMREADMQFALDSRGLRIEQSREPSFRARAGGDADGPGIALHRMIGNDGPIELRWSSAVGFAPETPSVAFRDGDGQIVRLFADGRAAATERRSLGFALPHHGDGHIEPKATEAKKNPSAMRQLWEYIRSGPKLTVPAYSGSRLGGMGTAYSSDPFQPLEVSSVPIGGMGAVHESLAPSLWHRLVRRGSRLFEAARALVTGKGRRERPMGFAPPSEPGLVRRVIGKLRFGRKGQLGFAPHAEPGLVHRVIRKLKGGRERGEIGFPRPER